MVACQLWVCCGSGFLPDCVFCGVGIIWFCSRFAVDLGGFSVRGLWVWLLSGWGVLLMIVNGGLFGNGSSGYFCIFV